MSFRKGTLQAHEGHVASRGWENCSRALLGHNGYSFLESIVLCVERFRGRFERLHQPFAHRIAFVELTIFRSERIKEKRWKIRNVHALQFTVHYLRRQIDSVGHLRAHTLQGFKKKPVRCGVNLKGTRQVQAQRVERKILEPNPRRVRPLANQNVTD